MKLENTYKDWFSSAIGSAAMLYAGYGWHAEWITSKEAGIVAFIGFLMLFLRTRLTQVISDALGKILDLILEKIFGKKGGSPPVVMLLIMMLTLVGSEAFAQQGSYCNCIGVRIGRTGTGGVISLRRAVDGATIGTITQTDTGTEYNNTQGTGHIFRVASDPRLTITGSTGVDWTLGSVGLQGISGGISLGGDAPVAGTFSFGSSGTLRATSGNSSITYQSGVVTATTGTVNGHNFSLGTGMVLSSGNTTFNLLNLNPTYNTTGTFSGGIARGILYNPTLTSTIGLTNIAFENTSGQLRFGGLTQDDTKTRILSVDATTNQVFWRDAASIGGGPGGASNEIQKNNGAGGFAGTGLFSTGVGLMSSAGSITLQTGSALDQIALQAGGFLEVTTNSGSIMKVENGSVGVSNAVIAQRTTTATPTAGIGAAYIYSVETSAGNNETGATMEAVVTDATALSEDFDLNLKTMAAGATAATRLTINNTGAKYPGDLSATFTADHLVDKRYVDSKVGTVDTDVKFFEQEEWLASTLISTGWQGSSSGTGAGTSSSQYGENNIEHAFGTFAVTTGTTATGTSKIFRNALLTLGNGNEIKLRGRVAVGNLSDATDTYTVIWGFHSSTAGAFFRYTHSVNTGKYECVTKTASTETATDSGITVDTQFHILEMRIAQDLSQVQFYIDGVLVATNTTNLPTTSDDVSWDLSITKSAGINARLAHIDWHDFTLTRTVAR